MFGLLCRGHFTLSWRFEVASRKKVQADFRACVPVHVPEAAVRGQHPRQRRQVRQSQVLPQRQGNVSDLSLIIPYF